MLFSIFKAIVRCQLDVYGRFFARDAEMSKGVLRTILLINMLEVEVRCQIGDEDLHCCFSKRLAKAYSSSTVEWGIGECMALLPIWGKIEWVILVESLRKKFSWPLPVVRIVVQSVKVYEKFS